MGKMSSSALLTLPPELIEAILICSCSPRTVASVARTCQTLRTLVYASPDSHLWREIFLTTWDDPRPALEHRALVDPRVNPATWDWGVEYRRRVRADKWLKAWRRDILPADIDPHKDPSWYAESKSTLLAVLDTLMTLRPFPTTPPIALTVLTPTVSQFPMENTASGVGERRERMASAPPLPPLLIVLASGFSAVVPSRSGVRLGRMVYGPHASRAMPDEETSTRTLIPTPSLPPHLVRALLASHTIGVRGVPSYAPHLWDVDFWARDPLGDVFHRIICITGFVAIPPPISTSRFVFTPGSVSERTLSTSLDENGQMAETEMVTQKDEQKDVEKARAESEGQRMGYIPEPFLSPSEQQADARILARRRVYDMQYLRGDRLWGPFHPVTRDSLDSESSPLGTDYKSKFQRSEPLPTRRRNPLRPLNTLAWAMGMAVELDDLDATSDDDSSDEDWRDPMETSQEASSSFRSRSPKRRVAGGEDAGSPEDSDSDIETGHSILSLTLTTPPADDSEPTTNSNSSRRRTRRTNGRRSNSVDPRDIKPEHLRPDYTYLASARIVVETNLKELLGCVVSDDDELASSDTRAGGVGMFWEDEDEILRARSEPFDQASRASVSSTLTPGIDSEGITTTTFELEDLLSQFRNLEVARAGGACGYWSAWIARHLSEGTNIDSSAGAPAPLPNSDRGSRKPRIVTQRAELEKPTKDTSIARSKGKGKGKHIESGTDAELGDWEIGPEGEACEGWDWAGVSGIWRRCVCWMDYRELLFFNLDPSKFISHSLQEACRIIPIDILITGYTRAQLIPVYDTKSEYGHTGVRYFRPPPVIHFSGLSVGSDRGMDVGLPVKGSVQLIGGGEVRWQLDTYAQKSNLLESSTPEWSSEGVQIGAIGSAIGILGMWTGARHERADPLGPFWMWKVA